MCQGINIRAEQGRKIPSSWGLGDGKHLGCAASGHGAVHGITHGSKSQGTAPQGFVSTKCPTKINGRGLKCFAMEEWGRKTNYLKNNEDYNVRIRCQMGSREILDLSPRKVKQTSFTDIAQSAMRNHQEEADGHPISETIRSLASAGNIC